MSKEIASHSLDAKIAILDLRIKDIKEYLDDLSLEELEQVLSFIRSEFYEEIRK